MIAFVELLIALFMGASCTSYGRNCKRKLGLHSNEDSIGFNPFMRRHSALNSG